MSDTHMNYSLAKIRFLSISLVREIAWRLRNVGQALPITLPVFYKRDDKSSSMKCLSHAQVLGG